MAMVRGEKSKRIWDGHIRENVYGSRNPRTMQFLMALVRELVSRGVLYEIEQNGTFWGRMNTCYGLGVTQKGQKFLMGSDKMMVKA